MARPLRRGQSGPDMKTLAEAIADHLMASYGWPTEDVSRARRLQLRGPDEEDLGGLCRDAVVSRIKDVLSDPARYAAADEGEG